MLTTINRITGNNPGGNISLKFAPVYSILFFPEPINGLMPAQPVFVSGSGWIDFDFMENKLGYDEAAAPGENGGSVQVSVKGVTRGDSSDRRALLYEMVTTNAFIVLMKDNSQMWRVIGTPKEPLQFSYKFSTADSMPGLKAYSFEFAAALRKSPPFI